MKEIESLEDLSFDPKNANDGTLRGEQLLDLSLTKHGAARPIVVDKHGVCIGANKTLQLAIECGLSLRVVKSDGTKLVVVVRTDLDLETDPSARTLAYLDNRTAEVGLNWNAAQLEADLAQGLALDSLFTEAERRDILTALVQTEKDDPTPPLSAVLEFSTPAQRDQWRRATAVIGEGPERLIAWVDAQMANFTPS